MPNFIFAKKFRIILRQKVIFKTKISEEKVKKIKQIKMKYKNFY